MTTTYVNARDAIVAHFNTQWTSAYPTVPAFYENTVAVDLDTVGDRFVRLEVDFDDARQFDIDLAPVPSQVVYGNIIARIFFKEGTGMRAALQMVDTLNAMLSFKTLSGVYSGVPTVGPKATKGGWMSFSLRAPFKFHTRF